MFHVIFAEKTLKKPLRNELNVHDKELYLDGFKINKSITKRADSCFSAFELAQDRLHYLLLGVNKSEIISSIILLRNCKLRKYFEILPKFYKIFTVPLKSKYIVGLYNRTSKLSEEKVSFNNSNLNFCEISSSADTVDQEFICTKGRNKISGDTLVIFIKDTNFHFCEIITLKASKIQDSDNLTKVRITRNYDIKSENGLCFQVYF